MASTVESFNILKYTTYRFHLQKPTKCSSTSVLVLVGIMRMSLKVQLFLTWAVVNIFLPCIMSQCHTTPRVQQKPADKSVYQTDEIDLKETLVSVLKYAVIIQDEFWGTFGTNLTLTYPQDGSCSILGIGFPLSEVTSSMVWGNPITQIPILVNVLKISEDIIFIPSQNTTLLLTLDQFQKVCEELGIILSLKENGVPQICRVKKRKVCNTTLHS